MHPVLAVGEVTKRALTLQQLLVLPRMLWMQAVAKTPIGLASAYVHLWAQEDQKLEAGRPLVGGAQNGRSPRRVGPRRRSWQRLSS